MSSFVHIYLRIQVSEDIHSRFLHHCKQIWIIFGPFHIPDIFAFQFQLFTYDLLPCTVYYPCIQVKESQNTWKVDDSNTTGGAGEGKEKKKKKRLLNNTIQSYKSEIVFWAGTLELSFPSNLIWCIQMHMAFIQQRENRHRRKIFSKPRFSSALRIWPWKVLKSTWFLSIILKMFSTADKKLSKLQVQPFKLLSLKRLKLKIEPMCFSLLGGRFLN